MRKVASDFHETSQDYRLLLWEESNKFWGSSYSKWSNCSHFGFPLCTLLSYFHWHLPGVASALHTLHVYHMQYGDATWRMSMKISNRTLFGLTEVYALLIAFQLLTWCTLAYLQCMCRLLPGKTWSLVGMDAYQQGCGRARRRRAARYTGRACRRPRSSNSRCCSRRRCSDRVACGRTRRTSWERLSLGDSWRWTTREDRSQPVMTLWQNTGQLWITEMEEQSERCSSAAMLDNHCNVIRYKASLTPLRKWPARKLHILVHSFSVISDVICTIS